MVLTQHLVTRYRNGQSNDTCFGLSGLPGTLLENLISSYGCSTPYTKYFLNIIFVSVEDDQQPGLIPDDTMGEKLCYFQPPPPFSGIQRHC